MASRNVDAACYGPCSRSMASTSLVERLRPGGVDESVAPSHFAFQIAEHQGVHQDADGEEHDHHRLDTGGVDALLVRVQLLTERVAGDAADDLAREEAAPREGPSLLQSADERRQGRRDDH